MFDINEGITSVMRTDRERYKWIAKYKEDSINELIANLVDNYVRIIGNDMRYFTLIIDNEDVND